MKYDRAVRTGIVSVILAGVLALLCGAVYLWPRVVRPSEKTFSAVAARVFGDEELWFPLAAANPGVSKLRPWMVLRIPARTTLDVWYRDFRRRRGLPASWHAVYDAPGRSASGERWLVDVTDSPSPDGRHLVYELRGLDVDESKWHVLLKTAADSVPRELCGGDSSYRCAWAEWREDSQRFIVKVYTGYDEWEGEKPASRWIYLVGDRSREHPGFRTVAINTDNDLGRAELGEVMKLPLARARQAIQGGVTSSSSSPAASSLRRSRLP